ncbi:atlastin-2-like isoform X2 [Haemaphysalis longicornis]
MVSASKLGDSPPAKPLSGKSQVTTSQSFDGRLSDIDDVFTTHLRKLVPSLLQPDNLLVKEINGQRISCEEWMTYFQVYVNTFNRNKLPEPMSLLEATAEVHNLAAVAAAREAYTSGMEQLCGGNQPYLNQRELLEHHVQLRESARNLFSATHKVGRETFSEPYLEGLTKEIDQMFENIEKCNEKKKGAAVLGTPATLLKLWLVFYIASNAFTLLLKLLVLCKSAMNARARRPPNTMAN